jgi:preprotein translocase subunit SecE
MNEVVKTEGAGPADTAKLAAAILIAAGGIVAFYVLKGGYENWVRWSVFVGALVLGGLIFVFSHQGRTFWKFALDSRIELYKVFWPTRNETLVTTLVVFGFVVLMGLFFWLVDMFLAWATGSLLGTRTGG